MELYLHSLQYAFMPWCSVKPQGKLYRFMTSLSTTFDRQVAGNYYYYYYYYYYWKPLLNCRYQTTIAPASRVFAAFILVSLNKI
jgi:hypothetical protein